MRHLPRAAAVHRARLESAHPSQGRDRRLPGGPGPDHRFRTAALAGRLSNRKTDQGRGFFHDGRFKSLPEVVNHYNDFMHLGLSPQQKSDLVEYLKSI